jgi:hypothetical protein
LVGIGGASAEDVLCVLCVCLLADEGVHGQPLKERGSSSQIKVNSNFRVAFRRSESSQQPTTNATVRIRNTSVQCLAISNSTDHHEITGPKLTRS